MPHVLVLVGVPGSGKSMLSKRLKAFGWSHINQDELGDRRACENAVRTALHAGLHVVVDRCNIDRTQRSHWIRLASECGGSVSLVALQLLLPLEICKERARNREGHPTLGPHNCDEVIDRFANDFVAAMPFEGFSRIITAYSADEMERAVEQIMADAGTVLAAAPPPPPPSHALLRAASASAYTDAPQPQPCAAQDQLPQSSQQYPWRGNGKVDNVLGSVPAGEEPQQQYQPQQQQLQQQYQPQQQQAQQYQPQQQQPQQQQQYQRQPQQQQPYYYQQQQYYQVPHTYRQPLQQYHQQQPQQTHYYYQQQQNGWHAVWPGYGSYSGSGQHWGAGQTAQPCGPSNPAAMAGTQPSANGHAHDNADAAGAPAASAPLLHGNGMAGWQQAPHLVPQETTTVPGNETGGGGVGGMMSARAPCADQASGAENPVARPADLRQPSPALQLPWPPPQPQDQGAGQQQQPQLHQQAWVQAENYGESSAALSGWYYSRLEGTDQGRRAGAADGRWREGYQGHGSGSSRWYGRQELERRDSHQEIVHRLWNTFADPRSTKPYDSPMEPGEESDPRVILLFDLNGTLTCHTSVRRAQGVTKVRPGTEYLRQLREHFRLGIYTSSTVRTVQTAMELLEAAAGGELFERRLVLHREHTAPAPAGHVDAGGNAWDTLKPLARYFSRMDRVVLVDDDSYKSMTGEEANMLVVPCWQEGDASCPVLRTLSEQLVARAAQLGSEEGADVRRWTAEVSTKLREAVAEVSKRTTPEPEPAACPPSSDEVGTREAVATASATATSPCTAAVADTVEEASRNSGDGDGVEDGGRSGRPAELEPKDWSEVGGETASGGGERSCKRRCVSCEESVEDPAEIALE